MTERTIFLQALERESGPARTAFLAEACGADAELRQRVEHLLQSHSAAGSFLGTPVVGTSVASDPTPGSATETHSSDSGASAVSLDFLAPSDNPESLGRLDHYDVLSVVGRGGMGIVLRAFDEKLHRVVALKVMTRDVANSAAARKRFSREAKAAAAVVHDHIVPIHAIEESGPTPYLVMQFIEGQSLQQKIDAEGSLELREILRIGMQIASGLAAAHKQGLVHRDIKPSNILLENGVQRVKITDFGLARAVDDASVSQSGVVAGTPQYMSPEQAEGQLVDHRSDLFSLGSVLYAMSTGRPPFRAESTIATLKRVCEDIPRPIRELNPDMPDWLADIIARLHAKNPAARYQSAQEVAQELERRLAEVQQFGFDPAANSPASPPMETKPWEGPLLKWTLATLTIGGIVQVVLLAGWLSGGKLFGWAAAACGAALAILVAFVLYQFGKHWRSRWLAVGRTHRASQNRALRTVGAIVAGFLVVIAAIVWGNSVGRIQRLFHRELIVKLPDRSTVAQFWETSDTDPQSPRRTFTGAWPLEPRATVANTRERPIKLPPARYWMKVTRDGKLIEERLLTIGWGGREEIVVGEPDGSAEIAALQRAVDLKAKAVDLIQQQARAGVAAVDDLAAADIDLLEAQVRLAEARQRSAEAVRLLSEIASKQEQRFEEMKRRHSAGAASAADVNQAEQRVAEARRRLASAMEKEK